MQQTIFTSKNFEDKVKSFSIDNINNLEYKKSIIERWITAIKTGNLQNVNETQIDITFLNDIFGEVLEYEYKVEKSIKNLLLKENVESKSPDAVLGYFEQNKKSDIRTIIELKNIKTDLDILQNRIERITPVTQAFEYARKAGTTCKWIIVSNFKTIRLYNKESDRYELFNLIDLENEFYLKRFFYLLHNTRLFLQTGESSVDNLYKERIEEEIKISNIFYSEYQSLRIQLFEHIKENNQGIEPLIILEKSQKILDRIIFICFCTYFEILPNSVLKDIKKVSEADYLYYDIIWNLLKNLFTSIDKGNSRISKLNGGLFEKDELLDNLIIKDDILKNVLALSEYDYRSDLNVNILGHIFEQSITDLEKIKTSIKNGEQPFEQEEKNGKRKALGIFYTPEYITKHLVKETIGKWLIEKRLELGELELPELTENDYDLIKITKLGTLKTNPKIEIHKKFWNQYLEKFLTIKILDPACGSGAFLVQCLDFLISEYRIIQKELQFLNPPESPEEFKPKLKQGLTLDFKVNVFDIEAHILKNCLFGVDLNFESVEITKLSLWLKTVKRGEILCDIDYNIQQGNSLIDDTKIAGKLAFSWNERFKSVMQNGGFDIVVGNPPYVSTKIINEIHKKYFIENYISATGQFDLYGLFIEKGSKLLNNNGILGFITSNTFLTNKDFHSLRKHLFDNFSINSIVNLGETVFEDANVDVAILIFTNSLNIDNCIKVIKSRYDFDNSFSHSIHQKLFNSEKNNFEIKLNANETDFELIDKIYENKELLGNILELPRGIEIGSNSDKIFGTFNNNSNKLLVGRDIAKYQINFEKRYINFEDDKSVFKEFAIYYQPKILIQRIRNLSLKTRIVATLDEENYLCTNTLRIGILKNKVYDLKFILALLNSNIVNYIFLKFFLNKDIYAYQLERIPIPKISIEEQKPFIEKVNTIIASNKELSKITYNFTELLISDLKLPKLSVKLENWYNLTWSELNEELNKQKKNIQLKELTKWKTFFSEQQPIASKIANQINDTISKLDDMVFQLYNISQNYIDIIKT